MLEDWIEAQRVVIGYIYFKGGVSAFNRALSQVQQAYFEGNLLWLWGIVVAYNAATMGIPSEKEQFRKFARAKRIPEEKLFSLETELDACKSAIEGVDDSGFTWHMGRLFEIYSSMKLEEALNSGYKDLESKGYIKAKDELLKRLSSIEVGGIDLGQDGNIVDEVKDVMREVSQAALIRQEVAVELGFPSLDREMLGVYPGELMLFVGWTGAGKTTMCVNMAVHNAMRCDKNVVYITTETIRSPLRRRMFARMTMLPEFKEYAPVSSQKMKSGELTLDEKQTLLFLENFLTSNTHGILQVVQAPAYATVDWVRGKLLQYESQFKVDLVIVDDLRSITPAIRRRNEHEEIAQVVRDLKGIARTHANRGVPVVSPHHISREAYKKVTESDRHMFDLSALSGTSEAEKRSDIILGSWYDPQKDEHQIRYDILKMRDGKSGRSITLRVQWDFQYVFEAQKATFTG